VHGLHYRCERSLKHGGYRPPISGAVFTAAPAIGGETVAQRSVRSSRREPCFGQRRFRISRSDPELGASKRREVAGTCYADLEFQHRVRRAGRRTRLRRSLGRRSSGHSIHRTSESCLDGVLAGRKFEGQRRDRAWIMGQHHDLSPIL